MSGKGTFWSNLCPVGCILALSPNRKGETDGGKFVKLIIWLFVPGSVILSSQGRGVRRQGFDFRWSKEPSSVTAAVTDTAVSYPQVPHQSGTCGGMSRCLGRPPLQHLPAQQGPRAWEEQSLSYVRHLSHSRSRACPTDTRLETIESWSQWGS